MTGTFGSAADRAAASLGQHYRCASPFIVERSRIREYARAVQAFHPVHWSESAAAVAGFDAVVAPPTFASVIWQQARREILRHLVTGYRTDRILHIDQVLDIGRPLLAGDIVACDIYVDSFRSYRSYDVFTVTGVLLDQHGVTVQTGSAALLVRTGESGDLGRARTSCRTRPVTNDESAVRVPVARPPAEIDFDSLTIDTELPTAKSVLSPRDLELYTEVMGESGASESAGPEFVAPGTLILALAAGYAGSCTPDPTALTTFRAEFANQVHYLPVPLSDTATIEFSGRVVAIDGRRRTATVAIDAHSQGRKLFGYATANLRFPPSDTSGIGIP